MKYIVWGAKGHSLVLEEIIISQGGELLALFDRSLDAVSQIQGVDLFVGLAAFHEWCSKQKNLQAINAIVAIGGKDGQARRDYLDIFLQSGLCTPSLIHSSALVSNSASVGYNCQILAGAIIGPMVKLGAACIVNTKASIDHECLLHSGVHIAPGATLCGCVEVGENSMIGAGSIVLPRVKIGADVLIGAGSVVTCDIPDGVIAFGSPAKIKQRNFAK